MIKYVQGNIFDSSAQTLVNPVNCVGVMGRGLALEFKKWFPGLWNAYQRACAMGEIRIGVPWMFKVTEAKQVLCFPSKDHWKYPSQYSYIKKGLEAIREHHVAWQIHSMAMPPIGCGLGGLEWAKVKPMIEESLGDLNMDIEVFEMKD